jgi:antitoxin PrlF
MNPMPSRTKITSKGQVTIPNDIRKAMNMEEGDYLVFETQSEYEATVKVIKTQSLSSLLGALPAKSDETDFAEIRKQASLAIAKKRNKERDD